MALNLHSNIPAVPNAWIHASKAPPTSEHLSTPEQDDDEESDDDAHDPAPNSHETQSSEELEVPGESLIYKRFLRFLELGCGGSPAQGYPTLVVILSTIPREVSFDMVLGV